MKTRGLVLRSQLALCFVVVLASCSGSDAASTSDPAGTGAAATPASTPASTDAGDADATTTGPPADSMVGTAGATTTEAPTIQLNGPAVIDESAAAGVTPTGFTTTMVRITEADGTTCEVCMWLADEPAERAQGLMGVTDLGDAAGMAFVFDAPTSGSFYMFRTVTPLSIAWFGTDGRLVAATAMEPCADTDATACPLYSPGAEYQLALEVFDGGLAELGIGDGATAEVLAGTEAEACPLVDR